MSTVDQLAARDPQFAAEVAGLSVEQRLWLEEELALRDRAAQLARELGRDEGDVLHQLKQFRRSPAERLRLGLSHGRLRGRSAR